VEEERHEAVKKFGANLTGGNRLKRYLTVRKGKTLMKRGLRLLDDLQVPVPPKITNIGLQRFVTTNICNLHILHFWLLFINIVG
jgi:hypothetical protein